MDEERSIKNNANRYFNRYKKLKSSYENALNLLEEVKNELFYLENVKTHLENATDFETLEDIRQELYEGGYVKFQTKSRTAKKLETKSKPIHVVSEEGYDIYIGRNNKQNEELSLRFASRTTCGCTKDAPVPRYSGTGKEWCCYSKVIEEAAAYAALQQSSYQPMLSSTSTRANMCEKYQNQNPAWCHTNHKALG